MKDALIVSLLSLAPRKTGARSMGWFARSRASRWLVRWFVRAYDVDLAEADGGLADYPTLEALFTRSLEPGARPIDDRPGALVAPVDGTVAAVGRTHRGQIEVAPGRSLDVAALLGEPLTDERDVAVLYLSPRDYHRVHVPLEGKATAWRYVPGTLWPVFPAAVRRVQGLFQRNERAMVHLETDHGPVDVVLVGAFGVGRITLTVCELVTNAGAVSRQAGVGAPLTPAPQLRRGAELGVFHLGSTVVVVALPGRFTFEVAPGESIRMGQRIAQATARLSGPTDESRA